MKIVNDNMQWYVIMKKGVAIGYIEVLFLLLTFSD